ncbi:Putative Palmitoyltransferase [Rhizopus microsporus]|nr:Putative Palmitoyltransferase [Rhizopus microsporus]
MVSAILAILGWLLMFIGACMIGGAGVFWWIVVYELLLLSGILFSIYKQLRRDIFKLTYPDLGANPYNKRNPLKNMIQVLCQPQPKSYLRRRKMADPVIEKL